MHNTDGQKACIYLSTHSFEPQIVPVQGEDIMDTVRKMIGCEWVEVVHPRRLSEQYAVLVDEEGLLKASPVFNEIASYLYEIEQHGAGSVVQDGLVHVEERLPLVFAAAIHDKADMAPGNRDDLRRKLWRDSRFRLRNSLLRDFIFTKNLP